MPRTVQEILAQADELAKRFEDFDPDTGSVVDGAPLRAVREAFEEAALAQKRLAERVVVAKASGHSWSAIGAMLGTSGEAARQRYGTTPAKAPVKKAAAVKAASAKSAAVIKAAPRARATIKAAPRAGVSKAARTTGRFTKQPPKKS